MIPSVQLDNQSPLGDDLRSLLVSRRWSLQRPNGEVRSPSVYFRTGSKIEGYEHSNEAGWGIRDGKLTFHRADGSVTSISQDVVRAKDGSLSILLVAPGPEGRTAHQLREVIDAFDKDAFIQNFALGLKYGRRHTEPYLHYMFRPFSNDIYSKMLSYAPESSAFRELRHNDALRADGTSTRLVLPFSETESYKKLTPEQRDFWTQINAVLCGDEIRALYLEALAPALTERFQCKLSEVPAIPKLSLIRDLASYKISIHPDAPWKTITAQFYLTPDYEQKDIGTGIYQRGLDGKFSEAHRVEFSPGSAYCFCVTKSSWHGVEPVGEIPRPRNSLMLTYFNREGYEY